VLVGEYADLCRPLKEGGGAGSQPRQELREVVG
jgi:hypothetical protein